MTEPRMDKERIKVLEDYCNRMMNINLIDFDPDLGRDIADALHDLQDARERVAELEGPLKWYRDDCVTCGGTNEVEYSHSGKDRCPHCKPARQALGEKSCP